MPTKRPKVKKIPFTTKKPTKSTDDCDYNSMPVSWQIGIIDFEGRWGVKYNRWIGGFSILGAYCLFMGWTVFTALKLKPKRPELYWWSSILAPMLLYTILRICFPLYFPPMTQFWSIW